MSTYQAPVIDDESSPFWEALAHGRLSLPTCDACGTPHYYPRILCPLCGSTELTWKTMSGNGVVHSYTVAHRRDSEGRPFQQVIALVDLDEGPRMLVEVVGDGVSGTAVGTPVTLAPCGEPALPFFTPRTPGEGA